MRYGILIGKTKEWARHSLMEMVQEGHLIRIRRGLYRLS